jgi:PAS domain S-box-containing protein
MSEQSRDELRLKAEEKLKARDHQIDSMGKTDLATLAHELSVYQVELEMQNEELRRSRKEAEEGRDRYIDLFDFAPVGFFTLDAHNRIVEVNLAGCQLLNLERTKLVNQPLTRFMAPEEADLFYYYRKRVMETGTKQTTELKFRKTEGTSLLDVQLDGIKTGQEGIPD